MSSIVAGVDRSQAASDAVALAARLAREHDGQLVLCHSFTWILPVAEAESTGAIVDPNLVLTVLRERGQTLLREAAEVAKAFGVEAKRRLMEGDPAGALIEVASQTQSRLIVMGTRGRHGLERLYHHSTTEAVLRLGNTPVLTVRSNERTRDTFRRCFERVIVGIDGSEPSEAAIQTVLDFPIEDRQRVLFCSVADENVDSHAQAQNLVDRAVARARIRDIASEGHVADGTARDELIAAAQQWHADVIVVGSHARRGVQRFYLGSVAEGLVGTAPVPVLVIRPARER